MGLLTAFVLAALSGLFYWAGQPGAGSISSVCGYSYTLCHSPQWLFYAAICFGLGGLLFRVNRI